MYLYQDSLHVFCFYNGSEQLTPSAAQKTRKVSLKGFSMKLVNESMLATFELVLIRRVPIADSTLGTLLGQGLVRIDFGGRSFCLPVPRVPGDRHPTWW